MSKEKPCVLTSEMHYRHFLTYKDSPERLNSKVQITHIYGVDEAREIINFSQQDYREKFNL
jgi:inorganic pyrophosphatase